MVSKSELYPLAASERMSREECEHFGAKNEGLASLGMTHKNMRARWTGEKRPPRKGEWYLSGAIVEAYKAANDLTTDYHIARLVRIEERTILQIVQE